MFSLLNIRIGFFLAIRQIRRANKWTTGLIVFVMVLTFLNLVVVSGILVGLIEGSIAAHHAQYTGDVIISNLDNKKYIEGSPNIINILKNNSDIKSFSARFIAGATIEANYQTKKETDKPNTASAQLIVVNPSQEDAVTGLSGHMLEGAYLTPNDYDKVLIGYFLLIQYITIDSPDFTALKNVYVGTKIRITVNGVTREVAVKGILKSKVDNVRRGLFMIDSEVKDLIGREDGNVATISIKLKDGIDPIAFKQKLILAGIDKSAKVQTYADAQPQFLKDIVSTFRTLGNFLCIPVGILCVSGFYCGDTAGIFGISAFIQSSPHRFSIFRRHFGGSTSRNINQNGTFDYFNNYSGIYSVKDDSS